MQTPNIPNPPSKIISLICPGAMLDNPSPGQIDARADGRGTCTSGEGSSGVEMADDEDTKCPWVANITPEQDFKWHQEESNLSWAQRKKRYGSQQQ